MGQMFDIRKWTRPVSYERGKRIYMEGRVLSCEVRTSEDGAEVISANVKGSGRNVYLSEIELNPKDNMIQDYYCECPAYDAYPSLCKHCVAALLKYQEIKSQEKKDSLSDKTAGGNSKRKGHTPLLLQEILQKRARIKALPVIQNSLHGKVHLTPFLMENYHFSLEWKIGAGRDYIVKNVLELARCLEEGKEHEYGKQLSFVHTRDAFDEESRPLVDFILWWTHRYEERNTKKYLDSSYYTGSAAIRKMELDEVDLEKFLLAMGHRTFSIDVYREGKSMWRVEDARPPRGMHIRGISGGIELELDECASYKGSGHYMYFCDGRIFLDPIQPLVKVEDFLDFMMKNRGRTVFIDGEDAPVFCRDLLPELEGVFECEKESFQMSDYVVENARYEFYLDAPNRDLVLFRAEAIYGEKRFSVFDDTPSGIRDLVGEASVRQLVSRYANAFDNRERSMALAGDEELLYALLTEGIQAFCRIGRVFVSDALKRIKVRENPHVTLGVSLAGDALELSFSSEELTKGELIEILSKYQVKKKYYRLKNGEFVHLDDEGITVLQDIRRDLNLTVSQLKQDTVTVPKYRALYLDDKGQKSRGQAFVFERNKAFRSFVRSLEDDWDSDYPVPPSLDGILRPYQKDGFSWLKVLCRHGFGGILADDMGLGKTLQVTALLLSEMADAKEEDNRRTLIVVPASLVFNWQNELFRFAPELNVSIVTGKATERSSIISQSGSRDILLTSYDLLRRDIEYYREIPFFCQVIDEAQYIKNHNTKLAHAVKKVQASFRLALTGTPMENRLSELWSIFDYLMPGFLYPYQRFREEIEIPIVQNKDEKILQRLQNMIGPFVLRRLKREVLKDLPEKLEEHVYAPLEGEQKKLYGAHVQRIKMMLEQKDEQEFKNSKIEILSELTRLRQICCNPGLIYEKYEGNAQKMEVCLELIENAVQGGHKILLFSQFTSMLQLLQEKLDERGITFYTLTGNTGKEKRIQLVDRFNRDDTSVFCISLKAGGTGLNLTAADVVIHYDPWWNLAVQNQATDRAHRIGQTQVVTVYKLVMKHTIEENILKLQEMKKELAEQVLGGEQVGTARFSRDELLALLEDAGGGD